MQYAHELLDVALHGASSTATMISVFLGAVAGLALAGIIGINADQWALFGLWALIGGAAAFVIYVLVIGPFRLVQREKLARKAAEAAVAAKPADERQGLFYLESAHVETLNMYIGLTGPDGEVLSSSNRIVRGPEYDALLVPSGDIEVYPGTARLEIKAFPPTVEITEKRP